MSRRVSARAVASRPEWDQDQVAAHFLSLYGQDPSFCSAIEQLYQSLTDHQRRELEREGGSDDEGLARAVERFGAMWLLDHVPGGMSELFAWCVARRKHELDPTPRTVRYGVFTLTNRWSGEDFGSWASIGGWAPMLPREQLPITFQATWDPMATPRPVAQEHLEASFRAHLAAELERIAQVAEELGYAFADTRTASARHVRWLYASRVKGETYEQIADRDPECPVVETVKKAVSVYAKMLNLTRPTGRPRKSRV